jgi:nuclear cap-binding protein subunit 1
LPNVPQLAVDHPYYAVAQEILNWLQGRTDPVEVISGIDSHKERLIDAGENEAKALSTLRQIVIQSLLEIGSRSFSHFLNAVERYIKLIRHISMETDSKPDILGAITQFWRKNPQMMLITLNKFMQYQFTEPSDHISWAFSLSDGMVGEPEWQILKEALDKANGRVFVVQKKVDQLRKEQDDAAALQKAQENADMDTDVIIDSGEHRRDLQVQGLKTVERTIPQTAALTSALTSKEQLLLEQERCFELIFNNFIQTLKPSSALFSPESWERRGEWSDSDHRMYETWGWFRHFCRSVRP